MLFFFKAGYLLFIYEIKQVKKGILFVVSAPSGTGKTTIVNHICQIFASYGCLERVITYTTRKPRIGEIHQQDYVFVNEQEFKDLIEKHFFLEWSTAYGAWYGSPITLLDRLAQGISQMLIVDQTGAHTVMKEVPEAVSIWLFPKDMTTLKERLYKRNLEDYKAIKQRIELAFYEIECEERDKFFVYHIVNDEFQKACADVIRIIADHISIE